DVLEEARRRKTTDLPLRLVRGPPRPRQLPYEALPLEELAQLLRLLKSGRRRSPRERAAHARCPAARRAVPEGRAADPRRRAAHPCLSPHLRAALPALRQEHRGQWARRSLHSF